MTASVPNVMQSSSWRLFLLACLVALPAWVHAEKADRNKPLLVEAGLGRVDDLKQAYLLSGRVVLTKGSILIRGDKVELREDAQGYQFGLISSEPGQLAFFRQKREGLDEHFEGESETIHYDGRTDTVRFSGKAQLRRYRGATLADEFLGAEIVYNNSTEVYAIHGGAALTGTGTASGRVRMMLGAKPVPESASPSAPNPVLRPSSSLNDAKK